MASSNISNSGHPSENSQAASSPGPNKKLIGVMSAKGGVGKSFVAGLLASSLAREGYQVGILDADYTGSSVPMMFGLHGPVSAGKYGFLPLLSVGGVKMTSMNVMYDNEDQSVIWKQSLVGEVVAQLYKEVEWGTLDYLFVDMPPATSEVAVEIMQSLPFAGVIIVTTPQQLSIKMSRSAVSVAQRIGIPVLGAVENMAYSIDPDTGDEQPVFGQFGDQPVTDAAIVPVLTRIPIYPSVSKYCDSGKIEDLMLAESLELVESFTMAIANIKEAAPSPAAGAQSSPAAGEPAASQDDAGESVSDGYCLPSSQSPVCEPFSDTVMYLINSQENVGVLDQPDSRGYFLGSCGDRMQMDLKILNGKIIDAKFLAEGCGATYACGTMLTKMAFLKTLDQARQITAEELIAALDGLPADHEHCAELAVMTLREAIIDAIEGIGKPVK